MGIITQDYIKVPVRASAILTTGYVSATVNDTESDGTTTIKDCTQYNQMIVLTKFTIGSLTSMQVKVEFSPDNVTWYQETFDSISTGTSTDVNGIHSYAAAGNFRLALPIADRYIRISVQGTGTVTSSAAQVDVVLAKV